MVIVKRIYYTIYILREREFISTACNIIVTSAFVSRGCLKYNIFCICNMHTRRCNNGWIHVIKERERTEEQRDNVGVVMSEGEADCLLCCLFACFSEIDVPIARQCTRGASQIRFRTFQWSQMLKRTEILGIYMVLYIYWQAASIGRELKIRRTVHGESIFVVTETVLQTGFDELHRECIDTIFMDR